MTLDRLDTVIAFAVVMLGVSLLITIATQMISSVLGLRGTNLLWGIKKVLDDLGIRDKVDEIARKVLTDARISDSVFSGSKNRFLLRLTKRMRLATAIRPDELSRMLKRISDNPAEFGGQATSTAIEGARSEVDQVVRAKLQKLQAEFVPQNSAWTVAADRVVQQVTDSARQSVLKLETSFATVMDRVAQRFAMNMRFCTVILAFVVAFGVHLDSLQLLQQLATNPDQRNGLVNMREAVLKQAESVVPAARPTTPLPAEIAVSPPPPPMVAPAILKEAMDNLRTTAKAIPPATPDFASYTEAANWLRSNGQGSLEPRYQGAVLSALQQHATDLNNQFVQSGFRLIPSPYTVRPFFNGTRNLLGILITVAFLSLGAPFWFNALKGLSNLRTVLADNEKKETGKA
jgi:hypothetical protein